MPTSTPRKVKKTKAKANKKSKRASAPLRPTAAEILAHTAYPDAVWKLTPTQSGKTNVAVGRGGPVGIDWEVHGTGRKKIVVCFDCAFLVLCWVELRRPYSGGEGEEFYAD